ncbi:HET domain containing protein [Rhypophila sp. PSN 637]
MDYSTLPLGPDQIRLLTIEPIPPGGNLESPIKCRMYVRSKPLPTSAPIYDSGTIPPNYISFDHYVPNPPEECFGAAIRRDVAKIQLENAGKEIAKEQARHSRKPSALIARAAEKLAAKLHHTTAASTSEDLMIPIDDIPSMLTREDFLSMTRDISSGYPDMSIRTWESGPKTYGKLPLAQLNPFFQVHPEYEYFGTSSYSVMPLPGEPQQHPKPRDNSWKPENYIALSYAWGLESDNHYTIYINDKPVSVRENLFSALRHLRATLEDYFCPPDAATTSTSTSSASRKRKTENECSGAIWIDALCINQLSTPEKNSQVQLMSTIYNCAGNILVWLGEEDSHSNTVISFLEKKSALQRQEFVEVWDGSDPVTATTWRNMALLRLRTVRTEVLGMLFDNTDMYAAGHPFGPGEAKDLWDFFARGYWRRLWIIQELAMGRPGMPILCGGRITLWRYVRDAVLLFAGVFDQLKEAAREDFERERLRGGGGEIEMEMEMEHPIAHVAKIAQLEISGHRRQLPRIDPSQLVLYAPAVMNEGPVLGSTLRQAILLGSRAECYKAHDRVYGLLSVPGLPGRFQSEIKVDYSKPVGEVFLEFTSVCVGVESLDFLAVVDGVPPLGKKSKDANGEQVVEEMPSWVPDYAAAPERRIGIIEGEWRAGGETGGQFPNFWGMGGSCSPPKVIEGKRLQCSGKVVDEVVAVGAVSKLDLDAARALLGEGDPSLFGVKHMQPDAEEAGNADGTSEPSWPPAASILHKVLVGGCDLSGEKKAVERFKALYTAFSEEEPPKGSPSHRNWHFLNSSANLQIQGRPLSSYFSTGRSSAATAKAAQAHLAMTARTKMRRLIVTKSGLIGLAPIATQLGDKVISIVGYGKPVIARAEQSSQPPEEETEEERFWREYYAPKVFCLRGEAYVEGMMNMEKMPVNSLKPELMLGSGDLGIGDLVFV